MKRITYILIALLITSCKTKEVIDVEKPVILNNVEKRDSTSISKSNLVYVTKDTIKIVVNEIGDTIKQIEVKNKLVYVDKHDTIFVCKTDTIRTPVYVTKTKTKTEYRAPLWWVLAFAGVLIFALVIMIWLARAKMKRWIL